ncbi:hypothetical protein [Pedobacter sp. NJ-S-72]
MAEEIKYRSKFNPDIIRVLDENQFHEIIISKLINFDFIDSCYKEAVAALIDIASNDDHLLVYNSILGVLEVIKLDKIAIKARIKNIRALNAADWMVNPVEALEIIYAKINAEQPAERNLLVNIESLKNGDNPFGVKPEHHMDPRQGISYLLILYVNIFTGDATSGHEVISNIVKLHPREFAKKKLLSLFISLPSTGCIVPEVLQKKKKTDQIESIIVYLSNRNCTNFAKYQEVILLMFQAQQYYNRKEYEIAIHHTKECLLLFRRNNVLLNAMFMFNLLINIYTDLKEYDLVNEYKYEKLCLLDEHQVSRQLF